MDESGINVAETSWAQVQTAMTPMVPGVPMHKVRELYEQHHWCGWLCRSKKRNKIKATFIQVF